MKNKKYMANGTEKNGTGDKHAKPAARAGWFETRMEVRDYECDIEGIVNNAEYLHYLEHTRHLFLKHCGLSFAEMHLKGVDAVVARMTLQYKAPLRCDDEFVSRLRIEKEGVRYVLHQDIIRACDNKLSLRAKVELVCLVNGKLGRSAEYDAAFRDYYMEDSK